MFSRLRIGHKLFAANLMSAVVALFLAGGLLLERNHSELMEQLRERIAKEIDIVAANVVAAVVFDDWDNAAEIVSTLLADSAIVSLALYDEAGNERHRATGVASASGGHHDFDVSITDAGRKIGSIRVRASDAEVWSASRDALWSILSLTLFALLVGLLVSNRIQGVVTQPISDLSLLLRRVREGNHYELRADVRYPDEVGELSEDLNALLAIIEERDRYLEEQVQERTFKLESEVKQRRNADRARLESQQRFERAFQNAPIGMALVDRHGSFLQRNASFDEILQTGDEDELMLSEVLDEEYREPINVKFQRHVKGELAEFNMDVSCRTIEGREIYTQIGFAEVRDEDGQFLYSVFQLQDVTQARRLAEELEHQATHDALTGLGNRRTLEKQLALAHHGCRVERRPYTLAILDLDQFKVVNDTSGHAAGDALLVQISQLVLAAVREDDVVVRLGGDEFALLLIGCAKDRAEQILEAIRQEIEQILFAWEGTTHRVGMSAGAVYVHTAAYSTSEIMQQADAACFYAKESGRNQVHLLDVQKDQASSNRGELRWVQRLHTAVDNDQFLLYAQPILPLQGQQEHERLEILLRLRNPDRRGLIPPGAFLPTAERYGLSAKIDRWVIDTLLDMAQVYGDLFDDQRTYWVNLTGESFADKDFMAHLVAQLRAARLPEGGVNFEITETTVVRNLSEATKIMNELRELGCRFALDDFGKGLSSFGYLKRLPVEFLKIDGMFVRDIDKDPIDRMFVKSIIEIAHAMELKTVAEFVENDAILQHVTELGADYGQGFGLGRPQLLLPQAASDLSKPQSGA